MPPSRLMRLVLLLLPVLTVAVAVTSPPATGGTASLPQPDHIVIVMEENHTYDEVIGSPSAPYINALAGQGASFTNAYAYEHPSQPDYLDLVSGSDQGITDDNCPYTITAPNLASSLIAATWTFTGYAEDLPAPGSTTCTSGWYTRAINPWVDFTNVPAAANQPFSSFPTDFTQLPTVSIVVPNLIDDMHSGTIQQADAWLQTNIDPYVQWAKTHNSLLILTWDEDDYTTGNYNRIPTILVGPMVVPGQYTIGGNTLLKPSGVSAWDAGGTSVGAITVGDGSAQMTVDATAGTSVNRMFGLTANETTPSYTDLTYGLYLQYGGTLAVYESGTWRANVGSYAVGDTLTVAVENGVVHYYRNGTLLYTSQVAPTYPLYADAALKDVGSTLGNAVLCAGGACAPVTWTNLINALPTTTQFNLLRTIEDMYGVPEAGQSANAAPITGIWTNGALPPTTTPTSTSQTTTTPLPTATSTMIPQPTATSTVTPQPTATSTATPRPTNTPQPRATATSTPNPPDFTLAVSPASQTVTRPNSTSYTISLSALNGYSGSVKLSLSGAPPKINSSFSPNPVRVTASSTSGSTLSITTQRTTTPGTYTLTIKGSDGTRTHSQSITLIIQ